MHQFADLSELPTEFVEEGTAQTFGPAVEVQLLRIVQESLANVRKHARATHVRVVLSLKPEGSRLVVEDDGIGFDPNMLSKGPWPHLGLQSMRERAAAIGGLLTLETAPGKGTRVVFDIPGDKS